MKIIKAHINSQQTEIKWIHQNSSDDKAIKAGVELPDIQPEQLQKALDTLKDEACKMFNFDEKKKKKLDIKGISIKYKEDQTGVQISTYLRVDDESGLGASLVTPLKYDVHENEDFKLPEGTMEKVNNIRNVATNITKRYFDQMGLFSDVKS